MGSQVWPSLSVKESSLVTPLSCDEKVRLGPPNRPSSVNMMGSRLSRAKGERTSSQVAVAGFTESSKVTRRVWFPASMNALPVAQSTPIDGSPAPCWLALVDPVAGVMFSGAGWFTNAGAPGRGGGGGGVVGRGATVKVTTA